jgi:hypothetical protein
VVQGLGGRLDHEIYALIRRVELAVGDDARDLDQRIAGKIQPGHLAVDPDELIVHPLRVGQSAGN